MSKIKYFSNNSGGDWWLSDKDWHDLEAAGWNVEWVKDNKSPWASKDRGGIRWLGALAKSATREGLTMEEAVAEFERVTGQDAENPGCRCCGAPHYFYEEAQS